eukprot:scaffold124096_cov20-Prasinocladus_malaysianus.AAC.1
MALGTDRSNQHYAASGAVCNTAIQFGRAAALMTIVSACHLPRATVPIHQIDAQLIYSTAFEVKSLRHAMPIVHSFTPFAIHSMSLSKNNANLSPMAGNAAINP